MKALACAVSQGTVRVFANPYAVLLLIALSAASGLWTVIAATELALTLCLSILALAITSAILYVGETRECKAAKRDEALHAKIDELIHGVPDADDGIAGIERDRI